LDRTELVLVGGRATDGRLRHGNIASVNVVSVSNSNFPRTFMRRSLALTLSLGGIAMLGIPTAMARANVDKTKLPIGKVTTSAQTGGLWTCQTNYSSNAPGAFTTGPWFNGDGSWDLTKKAAVDGSVKWPNASTIVKVSKTTRVITGNGLPTKATTGVYPIASGDDAYAYDRNPNAIKTQTMSISLPASPKLNTAPQCVGSAVGVTLEGPLIFNAVDAGGRDAVAYELQDSCGGHPERTGAYHYHGLSACADKSKQYGWAFDGLAIWGPVDPTSGQELTNADLDQCHGTTSTITIDGKKVKTYHYVANYEYPYTVGCYRATPQATGSTTTQVTPQVGRPAGQAVSVTDAAQGASDPSGVPPTGSGPGTLQPSGKRPPRGGTGNANPPVRSSTGQ
jgi:YHYH protein